MNFKEQTLIYADKNSEYPENTRYSDEDAEAIFEDVIGFVRSYKTPERSGLTSSYHHKWNTTPNPEGEVQKGARMQPVIDAQWSDIPKEIEDIIKQLWILNELGNDRYILKESLNSLVDTWNNGYRVEEWTGSEYVKVNIDTMQLAAYILEQFPDIDPETEVWIHWWW